MLVPFLIMLREGIEAALIVGIIASYLKQTGRARWMPAVGVGVMLALALSLFVGALLQLLSAEFPQKQQELFEACVGLAAVTILTWMVLWMRRIARSVRQSLHASIDSALSSGKNQNWMLIGMVFLAVAREGLETVFFLLAVFQQSQDVYAPLGALLGLVAATLVGYGLYRGGIRMNLAAFFRYTGLFILLVAAGIFTNAVKALHEAGVWNHFQQVVFDIGRILPEDGTVGSVLSGILGYQEAPTVSTLTAYVLYLAVALCVFFYPGRKAEPSAASAPTP